MNTKRILIVVASFVAIFAFLQLQRPRTIPIAKAAVTPILDCTNWKTLHPDWFYCQDFENGDGGLGNFEIARSNGVRCNSAGQNSSCAYSNIVRDNYGIPPYPDVTSYPAKTQTFFVKYSVKVPENFFTGPGSHGYYLHGTGGAAVIDPWPGYGAMNNIEWDEYTRLLLRGSGYQRTSTSFEGFVPKQRGQWHTYQIMIVPSQQDPSVGRMKVWIDGELANDTKTDTLPSYSDFTISNYWHSNEYITKDTLNNLFESYTAPLHPAFEILFDNLVLSNKFIEDATNTFTLERVKYNTFSAGSFKVNFDTTLPATGKVEWGQTTSYGSQAQESSAAYVHSLTLTNLQPSTQYSLRLSATDANNRTTETLTTFTTTVGNVMPQFSFSGWQGEVYQNKTFVGNPVFAKNFNDLSYVSWSGQDSDDLIRTDLSMAVRYTKTQTFTAGDYTVRAAAWDGIRVFVDGQSKVDAPGATGGYMRRRDFNINLSAGNHTFIVEHIMDRKPCPDWECKQRKQLNFAIVPVDTTAPKIISQAIYNLPEASTPTRPYFSGKCDEDCKATIDFGLTAAYGSQLDATAGDGQGTAITTLPAALFPILSLGQTYHYRVTVSDNAGNQRAYPDQTFVVGDTIPPQQIITLRLTRTNSTTLRLTFTAPGNSGRYGQAASYDVRYSTSPLTIYTWPSATKVASLPAPQTGETAEGINVPSMPSGQTYYFGITATDAAGNTSLLSNIASNPQGAEVIDMDGDGYGVGSTLGSDCNDYNISKHAVNRDDTSGYCVGSVVASTPTSTNGGSTSTNGGSTPTNV
ncbi:MAG: Ig-like domain repeat protein, partial [Patescibacteria group bacterium]